MAEQRGQATVELLAAVPLLFVAASIALQLLLAGYALTLADGAAEAGALALTAGRSASRAAERSLPAWARGDAAIAVRGGEVSVRLRTPSALAAVSAALTVSSEAYARPAGR